MPIPIAAIQAGLAAAQTIGGLIQAKKGRTQLEGEIARLPQYQQSQGILDYYNQALNRYGVSPTQTAMYKRQMQNIQRAGATGLAGARGTAARMGAASSIARSLADASLGAEVSAEQEQARRFGQLGQAAQLKRGEESAAFQQNLVLPSQMRLQMASQKAAGGAQLANVGLSNLFGAAQSAATQGLYKDIYGSGGSEGGKAAKLAATSFGKGGKVTAAGLGSMDRTSFGMTPSSISGPRISSTPSGTKGISMMPRPFRTPFLPPQPQQPPYFF